MTTGQPPLAERLVLGLDVGGTSTRVLVAALDGRVLGTARGAGGNPVAHGVETALKEIGDTVRAALTGLDPRRVEAGRLGLAGGMVTRLDFPGLWASLGLATGPELISDAELAHAAGTPAPDGNVLLSGTGAVAAEIRDHALRRTADGHGWLLGDRGSGFWLGREAVSATLTAVDRGHLGDFAAAIADALVGPGGLGELGDLDTGARSALVAAAHAQAPARLARFAPIVLDHASKGDPEALALVERAAAHLLDTLRLIRAADSPLPIVLAGGLLSTETPLAAHLRPLLAAHWPAAPLHTARNGAGAAAWLAARSLGHGTEALHRRLTA
ncbi:N-acetylglucosamine kinase [Streptomyces sp. TLI_171]|uniref:N-acetylglucosamine kinase n=1 Tax=Streptomyces sp. TLI_171 TaxID=1938859 RepID=UPI000C185712|nr:BadF/BadG/BcrA/BcrD ATPase family protein [Streptomyces sp. TLI_171]RKE19695.1 N-acetylglucosamine kinase-like BadF-type ATPase [Streptomyces sp. TLI_171]